MAATKFVLEIELGNDEMKLPSHVAEAVAAVVKQVPHVAPIKGGSVKIRDKNGNTVGTWGYK